MSIMFAVPSGSLSSVGTCSSTFVMVFGIYLATCIYGYYEQFRGFRSGPDTMSKKVLVVIGGLN